MNRKHTKGEKCRVCCCSGSVKCTETEGCAGHIHQDVVDEICYSDGDYSWVHNYRCDTCDYTSYFVSDLPVEFEDEN